MVYNTLTHSINSPSGEVLALLTDKASAEFGFRLEDLLRDSFDKEIAELRDDKKCLEREIRGFENDLEDLEFENTRFRKEINSMIEDMEDILGQMREL